MKIKGLHCHIRRMKLKEPYSIYYESVDSCDGVFIRIETGEGMRGLGFAAPDPAVTGENANEVYDRFTSVIEPCLKGADVFEYARIMESLKNSLPDNPSARAMVDMALYDLLAQKAGVPLYKLLGGYRKKIATSITIGILPLDVTLSHAREYLERGFKILKIKGGKHVEEDIEKIVRVRASVGKQIRIRFDANQGYSLGESLRFLKETGKANVELLEQPTLKTDLELLKKVTIKSPIPVMADESLLSLSDVFEVSRHGSSDLINIKLMKTGGIMEAMQINSVARAAGIKAMVGCMDESALGISAALHFALSRPNVEYADLDGHLDLVDDPFEGMIRIEDGTIYPPVAPGLGWIGTLNPSFD
jgi:L-alanine-DL-glutamate epimerase-like enolase superfamily enzyme